MLMRKIFSASIIIIFLFQNFGCNKPNSELNQFNLNEIWQFRMAGDSIYLKAMVPGLVHLDLMNAGIISDPFYRSNEDSIQWVANKDWEYKNEFELDEHFLKNKNIELVFEGLDTYADVYLNDSLIIEADNMFRQWKIEVSKLLQPQNTLRIYFYSALKQNSKVAEKYAYPLPEQRAFTRKAPYQFGWDWGPKIITSGIWKPVFLIAKKDVTINSTYFQTDSINGSTAFLSTEIEIESEFIQDVELNIYNADLLLVNKKISLKIGDNKAKVDFQIPKVKLWWTNGLGQAHLYEFKTELKLGSEIVDTKLNQIGIRTINLIEKEDDFGKSFGFKLNGIPVFMKGANYIPQDNFLTRVDSSRYESLIESAHLANMNMLRVWGGGIYENDLFYELCDKNGILIWQDFMFAGSMYPGDDIFIESCRKEAIDQIKRLRNHASIALWCGNNEVDEAWNNWGWQKQFNYSATQQKQIWDSYELLFHQSLPEIVNKYDPSRAYWPSSPKIGWGHEESLLEGDSHYWGVWWANEAFDNYENKVGRFMSEYGFQAFPDVSTLDSILLPKDKYLISPALSTHEKHNRGFEIIDEYMGREYIIPKKFEDYAYVSQLLQAKGVGVAIEAHRRAMPYCMGSLYWQLNDCWPVISWSSIDYYGNWKALHFTAKKAFDNLMISIDQQGDSIFVWIVSDRLKPLESELLIELNDFDGNILLKESLPIEILPNSSGTYHAFSISEKIKALDLRQLVLSASLKDENGKLIDRLHYFTESKKLLLLEPKIITEVIEITDGYEISLKTNNLAKNIFLNFEGIAGHFTENYFDLLPNKPKKIKFLTTEKIENSNKLLSIKSLVDTY